MLAGALLRGLLIMCMGLGFPKDAFPLQFLLQDTKCLVHIVVSHQYLQSDLLFGRSAPITGYFFVLTADGLNQGSPIARGVGAVGTWFDAADRSMSISLAGIRRSKPSTSDRTWYCTSPPISGITANILNLEVNRDVLRDPSFKMTMSPGP
jgi:hypothetical protein